MNNIVFVVNKGCHDYSIAERFGKLVFLSNGPVPRYDTTKMLRLFEPIIKEHAKNTDYLLLGGLSIMSVIACTLFSQKHNCLNLLLYSTKDAEYILRKINYSYKGAIDVSV